MAEPAPISIVPQPDAFDAGPVIDRAHLSAMTLGDRQLEREVLELFDRQAELLIGRMRTCAGPSLAALAHTLKGSALNIGAVQVARAARAVEAVSAAAALERDEACDRLAAAVTDARAVIATLLASGKAAAGSAASH